MIVFLLLLLCISVLLEGTVTTLPLVFVCLLCLTILQRNALIFFFAFVSGIFLDVFALRPLGETSIFLLTVTLLIILYQRKYEINSYPFVIIASFLGSFAFLFIFGYSDAFLQAGLCALIAIVLFAGVRLVTVKGKDQPFLLRV